MQREAEAARPARPWVLRQRWSRLLFAHWPVPAREIQQRLPAGLQVDTLDGWGWLGVVPFLMDRVGVRVAGEFAVSVPGATAFPELNLRTYVRDVRGRRGVYFFSLDAGSLLGVIGARVGFGLPYFWADISSRLQEDGSMHYRSRRLVGGRARFAGEYASRGVTCAQDDLRSFLTERYALYVHYLGAVRFGEIHHAPWHLEEADADFQQNELPQAFGFTLPDRKPVLHYAPEVFMQAWTLERVREKS